MLATPHGIPLFVLFVVVLVPLVLAAVGIVQIVTHGFRLLRRSAFSLCAGMPEVQQIGKNVKSFV